jgi:hypothetical protein
MNPSHASTPPATSIPVLRIPRMKPTPMYSGVISPDTVAAGNTRLFMSLTHVGASAITPSTFCKIA